MRIITFLILSSILLTSCSEIRTNDAIGSYKYWAGTNPAENIEVLKGVYWQSGHWTREYILYLKLKPTNNWWDKFVKQNQLKIANEDWIRHTDTPDWFKPTDKIEVYKHADDFNDSRYFMDKATGECYIYEIQL
ncbi:MAG: hypothetical protein KAI99_05700 [Cyclobacteriaceae bacterium]|nr:hypothetical protein [Cyclobacteriaceae bacterium]